MPPSISLCVILATQALAFAPASLVVLTVGDGTTSYAPSTAAPVHLRAFDASGAEQSGLNDVPVVLTVNDEIEGDMDLSPDGCFLSFMGYTDIALGQSTKALVKTMSAIAVNAATGATNSSSWLFDPGQPPTYSRADGAVVRPDGDVYMLGGQSASCQLTVAHPGERAPYANVTSGFAARGLQIAGREPALYQLYVGGGGIIRRIGLGLPSSPALSAAVVMGGVDFGAGWEFQSDSVLWTLDRRNVNDTQHEVHKYLCSSGTGEPPCPEGGTWSRDVSSTWRCTIGGVEADPWYLALNARSDDSSDDDPFPVIFMSTREAAGANRVVRLDTATGVCTEFVPPTPLSVYRGLVVLPAYLTQCSSTLPSGPPGAAAAAGLTPGAAFGVAAATMAGTAVLGAAALLHLAKRPGWGEAHPKAAAAAGTLRQYMAPSQAARTSAVQRVVSLGLDRAPLLAEAAATSPLRGPRTGSGSGVTSGRVSGYGAASNSPPSPTGTPQAAARAQAYSALTSHPVLGLSVRTRQ